MSISNKKSPWAVHYYSHGFSEHVFDWFRWKTVRSIIVPHNILRTDVCVA